MVNENNDIKTKLATGFFGFIEKSGRVTGTVLNYINESYLYQLFTEKFGINWIFNRIISVDIAKTRAQVNKFKEKYPDDTPEMLADKLTTHKAFYTATIGFTSGLIPGNIPAILFDFVTTISAQVELIYEIAMVYGMDLEDETRKGEVLTLFALSAGSTKTAEATLKFIMDASSKKLGAVMTEKMLRAFSIVVGEKIAKRFLSKLIPVIGGIIGAALNASMVTLTGKGAKAFYNNLTNKNFIYTGDLPDDLKQIYSKNSDKTSC